MSRREMGAILFDRADPLVDAYEFFYEHDRTILALKAENDSDSFDRSTVISLRNEMFGRHTYGLGMGRKVGSYLAQVYSEMLAVNAVPSGQTDAA
jgi:hypothetical protein